MIKAIWRALSGLKMNTGIIISLAAVYMQMQLGMSHDQATTYATEIMQGVGGALMIIGAIHQKAKEAGAPKL